MEAGFTSFVVDDAVLNRLPARDLQRHRLSTFQKGVVPLTFKSYYYGMVRAASTADWPSSEWLARIRTLRRTSGLLNPYDLVPMQK